MDPTVTSHQ